MLADRGGRSPFGMLELSEREAEHVPGSLIHDQSGEARRSAPAGLQLQEPWAQETGAWIPVPVLGGTEAG